MIMRESVTKIMYVHIMELRETLKGAGGWGNSGCLAFARPPQICSPAFLIPTLLTGLTETASQLLISTGGCGGWRPPCCFCQYFSNKQPQSLTSLAQQSWVSMGREATFCPTRPFVLSMLMSQPWRGDRKGAQFP